MLPKRTHPDIAADGGLPTKPAIPQGKKGKSAGIIRGRETGVWFKRHNMGNMRRGRGAFVDSQGPFAAFHLQAVSSFWGGGT